jgi:beta-glucanase (GH16 family)
MKKIFLVSAMAVLAIISCQKDDDQLDLTQNEQSAIDPNTPSNAQPLIIEGSSSVGKIQAPPGTGWTLKASDEFNDATYNTNKWTKLVSPTSRAIGGNQDPAITWWGWVDALAWQADGKFVLASKKASSSRFECAAINSDNKTGLERKYGYYESSIDIQSPSQGSHTAFWLQGDNQGDTTLDGSNGAEIDIFESAWTNDTSRTTIHIDGYGSAHESIGGGDGDSWTAPDINYLYRTYGLDWSKTYLKTYYNGILKKTITGTKWIPTVNEYIILSTGASFGSGADGFSSRAVGSVTYSYVDWIRVYNKDGDSNYN